MEINVEITGTTALLMNKFDENPTKEKKDKNATPREEATKKLYIDEEGKLFLPMRMIYSCIIEGGKFHKEGKNKITTMRSSLISAAILPRTDRCYLTHDEPWDIFSTPVVVPATQGRIMCHRPMLHNWKLNFAVELDPTVINEKTLRMIVDDAGTKCGLGDFRPNRKGYYGRFVVTKWESKR